MYPVPWLRAEIEIPVTSESGTRTEYCTELANPINRVYLREGQPKSLLLGFYPPFLQGSLALWNSWSLGESAYKLTHAVDSDFREWDQFSGSSGSFEGAGTRTMSFLPFCKCRVTTTWSVSTSVIVPGTTLVSMNSAIIFFLQYGMGNAAPMQRILEQRNVPFHSKRERKK